MKTLRYNLRALLTLACFVGMAASNLEAASPTFTPTNTQTSTPTGTPTGTQTSTRTFTQTFTAVPGTDTFSPTITPTPTYTATPVPCLTPFGPVLYLRAQGQGFTNGQLVGTWSDLSGSGHNAVAAPGNEPTYYDSGYAGRPVLRFDGSNDFMGLASSNNMISDFNDFTVIIKSHTDSSGSSTQEVFSNWTLSNVSIFMGRRSGSFWSFTDCMAPSSAPISLDTTSVMGFTSGSGDVAIYQDGAFVTGGAPFACGINTNQPYVIGAQGSSFTEWFKGDLEEIIVYDRLLTLSERITIENCMNGAPFPSPTSSATPTLTPDGATNTNTPGPTNTVSPTATISATITPNWTATPTQTPDWCAAQNNSVFAESFGGGAWGGEDGISLSPAQASKISQQGIESTLSEMPVMGGDEQYWWEIQPFGPSAFINYFQVDVWYSYVDDGAPNSIEIDYSFDQTTNGEFFPNYSEQPAEFGTGNTIRHQANFNLSYSANWSDLDRMRVFVRNTSAAGTPGQRQVWINAIRITPQWDFGFCASKTPTPIVSATGTPTVYMTYTRTPVLGTFTFSPTLTRTPLPGSPTMTQTPQAGCVLGLYMGNSNGQMVNQVGGAPLSDMGGNVDNPSFPLPYEGDRWLGQNFTANDYFEASTSVWPGNTGSMAWIYRHENVDATPDGLFQVSSPSFITYFRSDVNASGEWTIGYTDISGTARVAAAGHGMSAGTDYMLRVEWDASGVRAIRANTDGSGATYIHQMPWPLGVYGADFFSIGLSRSLSFDYPLNGGQVIDAWQISCNPGEVHHCSCGNQVTPTFTPTATFTPGGVANHVIDDFEDLNNTSSNGGSTGSSTDGLGSTCVINIGAGGCNFGTTIGGLGCTGTIIQDTGNNPYGRCDIGLIPGNAPVDLGQGNLGGQCNFSFKANLPGVTYRVCLVSTAIIDGDQYCFEFTPTDTNWHDYTVFFPDTDGPGPGTFQQGGTGSLVSWAVCKTSITHVRFECKPSTLGPVNYDFSVDDIDFGNPRPITDPNECVVRLGCTLENVGLCRRLQLPPLLRWIILRLTVYCGCTPVDIINLRASMSWAEICEYYGQDWVSLVSEVENLMAGLPNDDENSQQSERALQNNPPPLPPVIVYPHIPATTLPLPPTLVCP